MERLHATTLATVQQGAEAELKDGGGGGMKREDGIYPLREARGSV